MASNVGVICALAPFFTAIVAYLFLKEEPLRLNFFLGFVVAMVGIYLISFSGASNFQLNPLGDILAVAATIVWAFYSVLTRKISSFGYDTLQTTRKMFFYGILFMIPTLFLFDFKLGWSVLRILLTYLILYFWVWVLPLFVLSHGTLQLKYWGL